MSVSKVNVGVRKFPHPGSSNSHLGRAGGRVSVKGSPHVPLDGFAKCLMLGSTAVGLLVAVILTGFNAFPLVIIAAPAAVALGFMIAGMGGKTWARITAVAYCGMFFLIVQLFLAHLSG